MPKRKTRPLCHGGAVTSVKGKRAPVTPNVAVPRLPCGIGVLHAIEPEDVHDATVILLHGLGDSGAYWQPFYTCLTDLGANVSGLRWLALDAPNLNVWGERTPAWFEYLTDRSGQDAEDEIDEAGFTEMRCALLSIIEKEVEQLTHCGGPTRVVLVGSSQGGSLALDAAVRSSVAGVILLRSLVLGVTLQVLSQRDAEHPVPVCAVSGDADETFVLNLVRKNLGELETSRTISLCHHVVSGLDHDTNYDQNEIALTLNFIIECLGLGSDRLAEPARIGEILRTAVAPNLKSWAELSEEERHIAARLGVRSATAWDDGEAAVWCKPWLELTQDQQHAARLLGFAPASWDEDCEADDEGASAMHKSWAHLTDSEKKLALQLGVTGANAWDNGTAPVWSKSWHKLDNARREAAKGLGYDQCSWDAGG